MSTYESRLKAGTYRGGRDIESLPAVIQLVLTFCTQSSLPVIHKVGNVVNFVLLRSEGQINSKKFANVGLEQPYLRILTD